MAVIQDLPAELLYRILELMTGTQGTSLEQADTRRSFAGTALVARSWRAPSQYLLASTLQTYTGSQVWERYLAPPSQRFTSPVSTMQYLLLDGSGPSADDLALLQQRGITVRELHINQNVLLKCAHVRLFQGVRRLTLWGSVELDDDLGDDTRFALEALHIGATLRELPAWILPLSTVAPRLTRLTLTAWVSYFSDSFNAPLQELAPQLSHLCLEHDPSLPLQGDDFDLDRFLSACTSLTSLQCDPVGPSNLKHILSCLPSLLTLLNVELSLHSVENERELMTVHLAGVFDHPCMVKLKRWRMSGMVYEALRGRREILESAMEEWRAACRARGIEPRGAERYFTD